MSKAVEGLVSFQEMTLPRWGTLLFSSSAIDFQWDGTNLNGSKVSDGVHFWIINYREVYGEFRYIITGIITVMDSE